MLSDSPVMPENAEENAAENAEDAEPAGAFTVTANDQESYRILVTDESGNPVEGALIQFCDDTTCNIGTTDAAGIALFEMPEGTAYEVHVLQVPEMYEKPGEIAYTLENYSDVAITLKAAQ